MTTDKATASVKTSDFILSSDPNRAMQEMMETIDALRAIYVEENKALSAADARAFMAVQDNKITAARKYQSGASQLLERREEIGKKLDPRLRQALYKKQKDFDAISRENIDKLERMRKGTERLGRRIQQAVCDTARKDTHFYSARGNLEPSDRRVSVSLNESA